MNTVFHSRLAATRKDRGLNQKELAVGIGMTQGAVSRWENGEQLPDIESLRKLCLFLDVSADYLIGLKDVE